MKRTRLTTVRRWAAAMLMLGAPQVAWAEAQEPATRAAEIAAGQAEKAQTLHSPEPNRAEFWVRKIEQTFSPATLHWHPFFQSAYAGGGFTLGAGYAQFVSPYNTLDVRGSYTIKGYKRVEAEFAAPRLFDRRGTLSVLGGWREATQVGFYGLGTAGTSNDDRVNYGFRQPYASGHLEVRPTRGAFLVAGGAELSKWDQRGGAGNKPSIEDVYTPGTLAGLGATPVYVHTQGTVGLDTRTSPAYSRRGGFFGVTAHDFNDQDGGYDFRQVDYVAVQHVPIGRDAWVLSLRGEVSTTFADDGNEVPFFLLPSLGGGSSLRGFASWRFRDRNSVLLSAEWRILVNQFFETAVFADAGKVTRDRGDLDLDHLRTDVGFGLRLHGPAATPLRIDFAKSREGLVIVFSSKAAF
jgi:hypothetical protein